MRDLAWLGGISLLAGFLYLISMSGAITLADAGLFHLICQADGIAHPPGYPLATALCHPFLALPLPGTLAGNLFSTFFALATLVVLYFLLLAHSLSRLESAMAALALGVATAFWSQAIVLEVYTLNTFAFLLAWYGTVRFLQGTDTKWLYLGVLAFGLGLANHWPLIVLSALAFIPWMLGHWQRVKTVFVSPRILMTCLACLLLGLSPYLLPLFKPESTFSMIGTVNNWQELWLLVSRQTYGDSVVQQLPSSYHYLWWLPLASIQQFGFLGYVLIPLGVIYSFARMSRFQATGLLVLWLANVLLLPLLSNYSFDESLRAYYTTWFLIGLVSCAIWFVLGGALLVDRFAGLKPFALAAMLVAVGVQSFVRLGVTDGQWVEVYNRMLLESLDQDAVLFVAGDVQTGPLGYLHYLQGVRPDVELRHQHNILFPNRLVSPKLPAGLQQKALDVYLDHEQRPIYTITGLGRPATDFGLYYRLSDEPGVGQLPKLDEFMTLLIPAIQADTIQDPFIRLYLHAIVYDYARVVVADAYAREQLDTGAESRLTMVMETLQGKIWILYHLLESGRTFLTREQVVQMIAEGRVDIETGNPVETGAGLFLRLSGDLYAQVLKDSVMAEAFYRQALTYDVATETCDHLSGRSLNVLITKFDC